MKKRLTSFLLVLALSFSFSLPAFAVDDMEYYSLPPVGGSEPSVAMDWLVSPSATGDGWTTADHNLLVDIKVALTDISRGSMLWYLTWIYDVLSGDIRSTLGTIQQNTLATASRILDSNSLLGSINTSITGGNNVLESINTAVSGINGYATESTLSSYSDYFKQYFSKRNLNISSPTDEAFFPLFDFQGNFAYGSFPYLLYLIESELVFDTGDLAGKPSIYRMIRLLQETLASEDDRKLAENYKENREQAEQDFLNGKSGKTSLGKGDFSNASQVGGALNDTFNMGGAAKVSDFLSGFGSAGSESQSWFSQTTANNLNAVEAGDGTQGVSTFADDGETMVDVDPDPYNMVNIFERYDWLEGVNMDD